MHVRSTFKKLSARMEREWYSPSWRATRTTTSPSDGPCASAKKALRASDVFSQQKAWFGALQRVLSLISSARHGRPRTGHQDEKCVNGFVRQRRNPHSWGQLHAAPPEIVLLWCLGHAFPVWLMPGSPSDYRRPTSIDSRNVRIDKHLASCSAPNGDSPGEKSPAFPVTGTKL